MFQEVQTPFMDVPFSDITYEFNLNLNFFDIKVNPLEFVDDIATLANS